jgi:outer membrane protein TolC
MKQTLKRNYVRMNSNTAQHSSRGLVAIVLFCAIGTLAVPEFAHGQTGQLTLPQAIDLALKQNRSLKLAQLAVVDSEHKKEIARAAYFPQIRNESSVLHATEISGVHFPAGTFGNFSSTGLIPAHALIIDQGALTSYTSGTGLAQPLTQMFKIRASNRAATSDIDLAKIQVNQAEDEIAFKVRQLYYGILIARLKEQAADEAVNADQLKLEENTRSVEQGRALDVVVLESKAALLDAKQAALTQRLEVHDLNIALEDLLGLPLNASLQLDEDLSAAGIAVPTRDESVQIAQQQSPEIRSAEQAVLKARAGLAAARDAYIPDITGLARYSYQSGVPLLVHNFGTFGFTLNYDLFDGGKRNAAIKDSRTLLSEAQLNLVKARDEVTVQVETAYDRVEQLQSLVGVATAALEVRNEAARLAERRFEQNAALPSERNQAKANIASAKASLLEANLGLSLAEGDLKRTIGELPR